MLIDKVRFLSYPINEFNPLEYSDFFLGLLGVKPASNERQSGRSSKLNKLWKGIGTYFSELLLALRFISKLVSEF